MQKMNTTGLNCEATSATKYHFDCGLNSSERFIVYDELTAEKLSNWFKVTKYMFPLNIMERKDFRGGIYKEKETGEYILKVFKWNWVDDIVTDERTLRIGNRIGKERWESITHFITDYLEGVLQKRYSKVDRFLTI